MKRALMICFGLLFMAGCVKEQHSTLRINEDGTAVLVQETVLERAIAEQYAGQYGNRKAHLEDNGEDGDDDGGDREAQPAPAKAATGAAATAKAAATAATPAKPEAKEEKKSEAEIQKQKDEDLAKTLQAMFAEQQQQIMMTQKDIASKLVTEMTPNTVKMTATITFASLKQFVQQAPRNLDWSKQLKLEQDEKGKFRLSFKPFSGRGSRNGFDSTAYYRQTLEASKPLYSLKIVMPGKVIASTLKTTAENSAELKADTSKSEELEAVMKLAKEGLEVTSEPGKLKMDGFPLDSAKLQQEAHAEGDEQDRDVPLAAAPAVYQAVAKSIVTRAAHYFPGAEKFMNEAQSYSVQPSGCTLSFTLQAPAGRKLLKHSNLKLVRAFDDKKRELKPVEEEHNTYYNYSSFNRNNDEQMQSLSLSLPLPLPQADARTLASVEGEAEVLSFGKWKEHAVADIKPGNTEIDLADVLPGAKMVILPAGKNSRNSGPNQASVKLKVTGPKQVRQLHFVLKSEGTENSNSFMNQDQTKPEGQQFVRTATVQSWSYSDNNQAAKFKLLVRYPDDLKREKAAFKLEEIDLF